MIPSPSALGRLLRPAPIAPSSVAALLGGQEAYLEFRRIVRELFPDSWEEVFDAREAGADREAARVWAFCRKVETAYFPVYEGESYEQVAYEIPFVRFGYSYDRYHDFDCPFGELLLLALCPSPYIVDQGVRIALLDAAEARVPREVLTGIPENGVPPDELHARLDGTQFAPAADFADWLFGATGTVFLDYDDEVVVSDADWTRENVAELARQWRVADALLKRVTDFTRWLEADPAERFARLLRAAVGRDPHAEYERERHNYAYEITEAGLVPVEQPESDVALPARASG